MREEKKRNWLPSAISLLIGVLCALVLGALFYGAMAYQLAGEEPELRLAQESGATLALADAQLLSEQTETQRRGGQSCTVLTRRYQLEGGAQAEVITAQPAAYIERLSEENWTPQLITGFTLAGMEAVYALRADGALLCARSGDTVYMLIAPVSEQEMYALGAAAFLQ